MSEQRFKVIRSLLSAVEPTAWRWQLVERASGLSWALEQEGAPPTGIVAYGPTLSPQARMIGALHPAVLKEVSAEEAHIAEALETLMLAAHRLQRHHQRVYRLKQREHYDDLRLAATDIAKVLELLEGSTSGSARLLAAIRAAEQVDAPDAPDTAGE